MSMFKQCPECGRSNKPSAKKCQHCDASMRGTDSHEKPPLDPRCSYTANGMRCPCIGTLNVYYDANGVRHSKCRYHYRSGADYVTGNRILEDFMRNGPPRQPKPWQDIVIDKMEDGYSSTEAIAVAKMELDEHNNIARKIEPAGAGSERVKAQAIVGIQNVLRSVHNPVIQRAGDVGITDSA